MPTRSKRHRQPLEIMANLNVTNMLDTAFILLITFMLIAPQLDHGIKIQLPQVDASPLPKSPDNTVLVIIQQEADQAEGAVYVKDGSKERRVTLEELETFIAEAKAKEPEVSVVLEADRDSKSGLFIRVVRTIQRGGIERIGFSTEPENE